MAQETTLLENEVGIQQGYYADDQEEQPIINNMIVGRFKRGRLDKPMTITLANIRAMLGHDIRNKDYVMVRDALDSNIESIQVLRVVDGTIELPDPDPVDPVDPIDPEEPGGNETEISSFDFAVIRYIWTAQGGRDLDTRTRITNPERNVDVGWSRAVTDAEYLKWGGDNTADGVECVLLSIEQLLADFPTQNTFRIDCKSFWYSQVVSGNVNIQFATYQGGTMQQNGYDFVNVGGSLVQDVTLNCNTQTQSASNIDGILLAYLTYDRASLTGSLVKV